MRSQMRTLLGLLLTAVLLLAGSAAAASAAPYRLGWSPQTIDLGAPYGQPANFSGLSCPTSDLCIATDEGGNVAVSTAPTAPAAPWSVAHVDSVGQLTAISCPTARLCLATDSTGHILSSTAPTGPANGWTIRSVDHGVAINAIACPSAALCVAADKRGTVLSSTDPAGPRPHWTPVRIDPDGLGLIEVACPSSSLCLAADNQGDVWTTRTPDGGAGGWHRRDVAADGTDGAIVALSCPSTSLCVASDGTFVYTTTDPSAARPSWRMRDVIKLHSCNGQGEDCEPGILGAMSCPTTTDCVGIDDYSDVISSTDPTGGASAWHDQGNAPFLDDEPDVLTCISASACIFATTDGDGIWSSAMPAVAAQWHRDTVTDGTSKISAVACRGRHLCLAGDNAGKVFVSTDLAARSPRWTVAATLGGAEADGEGDGGIVGISCASAHMCVAANADGGVWGTSTPTAANNNGWHESMIGGANSDRPLESVSCPSAHLCLVAGFTGIYVSREPLAGNWHKLAIHPAASPLSVACQNIHLCFAVGGPSRSLVSTAPADASGWARALPSDDTLGGELWCASKRLCISIRLSGTVATANPTASNPRWHKHLRAIKWSPNFAKVVCPSTTRCVAVSDGGVIATTSQPAKTWTVDRKLAGTDLDALSCPTAQFCLSGASNGRIAVGRR